MTSGWRLGEWEAAFQATVTTTLTAGGDNHVYDDDDDDGGGGDYDNLDDGGLMIVIMWLVVIVVTMNMMVVMIMMILLFWLCGDQLINWSSQGIASPNGHSRGVEQVSSFLVNGAAKKWFIMKNTFNLMFHNCQ